MFLTSVEALGDSWNGWTEGTFPKRLVPEKSENLLDSASPIWYLSPPVIGIVLHGTMYLI